ncbi:MAG: hypothetical protein WCH52_11410 [Bacteroidota bacterium]
MKEVAISVALSYDEYKALEIISKEADVSKSEFIRLIVQGLWLGRQVAEGKKNTLEMGGYGFTFKPEEMEELLKEVGERLISCVDIKPIIGHKNIRYKSIKTRKKVA